MAQNSIFWETTTGTGDSNTNGYDQNTMFQLFRSLLTSTANLGGVSPAFQGKLAVTGSASPLQIADGAAVVYGIPYFNTTTENVSIPTPTVSTRIDRIVLRADWTAQTVRITRIAGVEGAGQPALTQSANATWDIPLYQVMITTGGTITLVDQREWIVGLADNGVFNAKLATMAQATIKGRAAGAGVGSPQDLTPAQVRTIINVADGANNYTHPNHSGDVTSSGDGATTIANDAVTNAKLANMSTATIKGRATAGSGDPEDLSASQVRTLLNVVEGPGYTHPNHSGEVTSVGDGATTIVNNAVTTAKINNAAVTTAKIANDAIDNTKLSNMAQNTIKGRISSGSGDPEDLTAAQVIAALGLEWKSYTPALSFNGNSVGVTYDSRNGIYFTIGKLACVIVRMQIASLGSSTGNMEISLPEGVSFSELDYSLGFVGVITNSFFTAGSSHFAIAQGNKIKVRWITPGTSSSFITNANIASSPNFDLTVIGRIS